MKTKQESIIDTALKLFSTHGYHAVGIDRIIEEAQVAKMTLYKHFSSKEVLIENVLIKRDDVFCSSLIEAVAEQSGCLPKLKAVFDWHGKWFANEDFYGCMFIKASEEFPEKNSKIRAISMDHKLRIKNIILEILKDHDFQKKIQLADHIMLILEGMIVHANMFSNLLIAEQTWPLVRELVLPYQEK